MSTGRTSGPCWSTACFGETADASPMELSVLGDHLQACRSLHGRLFVVSCAAEATQAFVASRFVTSVVGLVALAGLGSLAW